MAYPDNPTLIDWIDERETPEEIEDEEHTVTTTIFKLDEVPSTNESLYPVSIIGDVYGSIEPSFSDPSPAPGHCYINCLNGKVYLNAANTPDTYTCAYGGRGTANDEANLESVNDTITEAYKAALFGWTEETTPPSQSITLKKGNYQSGGKLVQFDGDTLDLSTITFTNPGYTKQLRIVVVESTASADWSEGAEGVDRTACETLHPPRYPGSVTVACVFLTHNTIVSSANILNCRANVGSDGGDDPNQDDTQTYTYDVGVVSGADVCLNGANNVALADADVDAAVPAIGFVSEILDDTYCTVRNGGILDTANLTVSYDALTPGQQVYLSTAAGAITQTRNKVPGEWDQCLGIALSASKIQIQIGTATKNEEGPPPGPDPEHPDDPDGPTPPPFDGKYKYSAGVVEKEFVFGRLSVGDEAVKVTEAKADSLSTLPALGIVTEIIDATWCEVKNNFHWLTTDHGGLTPGGLTPGSAGDKFWISATSAGAVQSIAAAAPDLYIQVGCIQVDAAGTDFLICCGDVTTVGKFDPPGNTHDCDSNVQEEDAVYFKYEGSPLAPKAYQAKADSDTTMNAVGIAINVASNRCVIKFNGETFESQSTHPAGGYYLSPWTAGAWTIESGIIYPPGSWKKHMALCDGSNTVWVSIGPASKQGGGEDAEDGDCGEGEIPGQVIGKYWSEVAIAAGTAVDRDVLNQWVQKSRYTYNDKLMGICLSCTLNPNYVYGENGEYIVCVLREGDYTNPALTFIVGGNYYIVSDTGVYGPAVGFDHYKKYLGHANSAHSIHVMPQNQGYIAPGGGDPVPAIEFVSIAASLSPHPEPMWFEKPRGHDGTNALDPIDDANDPWVSDEIVLEDYAVIPNIDFAVESTGVGSGAYLECDLVTGSGVSILSSVCELVTTGDGVRGDSIPNSGNSSGHTRAVVKNGLMPLVPGTTLYVKRERQGTYTTDPYGFMWIMNKYLVKAPA